MAGPCTCHNSDGIPINDSNTFNSTSAVFYVPIPISTQTYILT